MYKIKRASAAALCAVGITAGAIAMAAPAAAAGTGTANYSCSGSGLSFPSVDVEFQRNGSGYLTVTADIAPGVVVTAGNLKATLTFAAQAAIANVTNTSAQGPGAPVVMEKASTPTLGAAPTSIALTVTTPPVALTCTQTSSSWPSGGI